MSDIVKFEQNEIKRFLPAKDKTAAVVLASRTSEKAKAIRLMNENQLKDAKKKLVKIIPELSEKFTGKKLNRGAALTACVNLVCDKYNKLSVPELAVHVFPTLIEMNKLIPLYSGVEFNAGWLGANLHEYFVHRNAKEAEVLLAEHKAEQNRGFDKSVIDKKNKDARLWYCDVINESYVKFCESNILDFGLVPLSVYYDFMRQANMIALDSKKQSEVIEIVKEQIIKENREILERKSGSHSEYQSKKKAKEIIENLAQNGIEKNLMRERCKEYMIRDFFISFEGDFYSYIMGKLEKYELSCK